MASSCEQVPLNIQNQTINMIAYSKEKIEMKNKKRGVVLLGLLILLVLPLVYAGDYGAGPYDSDNYNVGEVPTTTPPSGGGSSGGSSSSGTTTNYECSLNSDCNETQYCFENSCYDAECSDNSACDTEGGESCWNGRCVKLFDIVIKDFKSPVKLGEFFEFTYLIKGMANISDDVKINFWIEKNKSVIGSGSDTIYIGSFEEKTETAKLFLPSDIPSGNYVFFIQLDYGAYQANSHRTIEITVNEGLATIGLPSEIKGFIGYIISALIGFFASILLIIFYFERRKMKRAIISEVRWIKKYKITLLAFLVFAVLGTLIYYLKWYESITNWSLSITSWINPYLSSYEYYILGGIVLLISLILLTIVARKERWWKKFKGWNGKREREVKVKKVKTQVIGRKEKIENRKNIKEFFRKYKVLLSVILLSIILAGIIAYLFYVEILTVERLENLLNSFVSWVKIVWEKIVSLF